MPDGSTQKKVLTSSSSTTRDFFRRPFLIGGNCESNRHEYGGDRNRGSRRDIRVTDNLQSTSGIRARRVTQTDSCTRRPTDTDSLTLQATCAEDQPVARPWCELCRSSSRLGRRILLPGRARAANSKTSRQVVLPTTSGCVEAHETGELVDLRSLSIQSPKKAFSRV